MKLITNQLVLTFTVCLLLSIPYTTFGQDVPWYEPLYELEDQAAIDTFITTCDCVDAEGHLDGSLRINDSEDDDSDITNLAPLNAIKSIEGNLEIWNTKAITDLTGFSQLRLVKGDLAIEHTGLLDLTGLENLESVHKFDVSYNDHISSLNGVNNLQYIGNVCFIWQNPLLEDLKGLRQLETVTLALSIMETGITSLKGLANLTSVGALLLSKNPSLENLDGLNQLTIKPYTNLEELAPSASLQINHNPSLINIFGLSAIPATEWRFKVEIESNMQLENLKGLEHVNYIYWLSITQNHSLSNLEGLNNLQSAFTIDLTSNDKIRDFIGLHELRHVEGNLNIFNHKNLRNLSLIHLQSVDSTLVFFQNEKLESFTTLRQLESVGSDFIIWDNDALTSLEGLENLKSIGKDLVFIHNEKLSTCCLVYEWDKRNVVKGSYDISDNAADGFCNDIDNAFSYCEEVEEQTLDFYELFNQADVDSFITTCNCVDEGGHLNASLRINDTAEDSLGITSLAPLNAIKTIEGNLEIWNTVAIKDLTGFSQLRWIKGNLEIIQTGLLDLTGLEHLESVGRFDVSFNDYITSFNGINNLTHTNEMCYIWTNPLLKDLKGLSGLKKVNWGLSIMETGITSLEGLAHLDSVGALIIARNPNLENLDGLDQLTIAPYTEYNFPDTDLLGPSIVINKNPSLVSIAGLSAIQDTNWRFKMDITENIQLENLKGLEHVNSIYWLTIDQNHSLSNLEGLNNLKSVFTLGIARNDQLIDFTGLDELRQVQKNFYIWTHKNLQQINLNKLQSVDSVLGFVGNEKLSNFNGLEQLQSIGSNFFIINNEQLSSLDGLNTLQYIGNDLSIQSNGQLSTCCLVKDWNQNNVVKGSYSISNNADDGFCNQIDDIIDYCIEQEALPIYELKNQQEVDEFIITCNCVDEVGHLAASLTINDIEEDSLDIISLAPLNSIKTIEGNLKISKTKALTDLTGFSQLRLIEGDLEIEHTDLLSLKGLENLESVYKFDVSFNDQLITLNGLDKLKHIYQVAIIWQNPLLEDLMGLSQLETVHLSLSISETGIRSLEGLANLDSIGSLYISDNPHLVNLDGLDQLHIKEFDNNNNTHRIAISLQNNPNLVSITGLSGIQLANDNFSKIIISQNTQLENLKGLEHINYIYWLTINENHSLKNLEGLNGLERVSILDILENDQLVDLSLNQLQNIDSTFSIMGNNALVNIHGLTQLETIGSTLNIVNNSQLSSLEDLEQLQYIGGDLQIFNNTTLSTCCTVIEWIENDVVKGNYNISGNSGTGFCNSIEEITSDCKEEATGMNNNMEESTTSSSPYLQIRQEKEQLLILHNASYPSTNVVLKLYDIDGRLIQQEKLLIHQGVNNWVIDLIPSTRGTYILVLEDGEKRYVERLVKW